jgi:GNAT superfamily N-acetyltransferase
MPITYRPGTLDDSFTVYNIFLESMNDLSRRLGTQAITGGDDPAVMKLLWESRRPLFDHLTETAEYFWLAEQAGQVIGYARSILRDGCRELTEYFVLPGHQSAGVGRELLERTFPDDGATHRSIVATIDPRAQARYLKTGVYPRFPIYYFERAPEPAPVSSDLTFEPFSESDQTFARLAQIDKAVLGYRRDIDHAWLMAHRDGFLYCRDRKPVGYGYIGRQRGPFALLDPSDYPAVLAHAEAHAHALGLASFGVEVPLVNAAAIRHLLARGFKMDAFFAFFMCDHPFGKFENYIVTSPPFFF